MNDAASPVPSFTDVDLLRWIPVDAGRVAECAESPLVLKAAYLRANPDADYIEAPLSALRDGDVRRYKLKPKSCDAVVISGACLPVHLKQAAELLAPGGVIVAALPNLLYWRNLSELLKGRVAKSADGSSLALGYCTRDGVQALFREAGLALVDMKPGVMPDRDEQAQAERFLGAAKPLLEAIGVNAAGFEVEAKAVRFLVRACAKEVRPVLIHSMMLPPQAAVNDVRVVQPNLAVGSLPGVRLVFEVSQISTNKARIAEDRIFIAHRPIHRKDKTDLLRWLVRNDYIIVTEFDDHPMRWPEIAQNDYLTFTAAHAVQTTNEPLAAMFRQYNPEVKVFPNAIAQLPVLAEPVAGGPVRLFFGALNRQDDWRPILDEWNAVLEKAGDAVAVTVVHDQPLFDALKTPHKTFVPTCGHGRYMELLCQTDVCIMPLEDTEFNRMKSDLKWLEAAASGAVALASPVVYGDVIRHGKTGLIFKTPKEFGEQLSTLIRDRKLRQKIREAAYEAVYEKRLLRDQARARLDWYRSLLARKEALYAQLKTRLPELFEG